MLFVYCDLFLMRLVLSYMAGQSIKPRYYHHQECQQNSNPFQKYNGGATTTT